MDKIHARIQESVYTKAEWEAANPVLLKGEKGFVSDDPNLFKIGDGVTAWNSLPWRGYTGTIAQVTGDNENAVMSQKATSAAIQANSQAISDEVQAMAKADEQLNTAIEAETTRAKAAEEAIIFDVSAHNDGAVFESIYALLSNSNLDTLIPTSVRRGGMTIRFIQGSEQGSDNKYVQYRYIGTATYGNPNPFLDTANWQGVDNELIFGSHNLVENGVIVKEFLGYSKTFTALGRNSDFELDAIINNGDELTLTIANATSTYNVVLCNSYPFDMSQPYQSLRNNSDNGTFDVISNGNWRYLHLFDSSEGNVLDVTLETYGDSIIAGIQKDIEELQDDVTDIKKELASIVTQSFTALGRNSDFELDAIINNGDELTLTIANATSTYNVVLCNSYPFDMSQPYQSLRNNSDNGTFDVISNGNWRYLHLFDSSEGNVLDVTLETYGDSIIAGIQKDIEELQDDVTDIKKELASIVTQSFTALGRNYDFELESEISQGETIKLTIANATSTYNVVLCNSYPFDMSQPYQSLRNNSDNGTFDVISNGNWRYLHLFDSSEGNVLDVTLETYGYSIIAGIQKDIEELQDDVTDIKKELASIVTQSFTALGRNYDFELESEISQGETIKLTIANATSTYNVVLCNSYPFDMSQPYQSLRNNSDNGTFDVISNGNWRYLHLFDSSEGNVLDVTLETYGDSIIAGIQKDIEELQDDVTDIKKELASIVTQSFTALGRNYDFELESEISQGETIKLTIANATSTYNVVLCNSYPFDMSQPYQSLRNNSDNGTFDVISNGNWRYLHLFDSSEGNVLDVTLETYGYSIIAGIQKDIEELQDDVTDIKKELASIVTQSFTALGRNYDFELESEISQGETIKLTIANATSTYNVVLCNSYPFDMSQPYQSLRNNSDNGTFDVISNGNWRYLHLFDSSEGNVLDVTLETYGYSIIAGIQKDIEELQDDVKVGSGNYVCLGDSITSDEITGIGTLICNELEATKVGNFAHGNAHCSNWHRLGTDVTPVTFDTLVNANTPDNVLSNQVIRILRNTTPLGQQVKWTHPTAGEQSIPIEVGTGLGNTSQIPNVIYIAISTNDGKVVSGYSENIGGEGQYGGQTGIGDNTPTPVVDNCDTVFEQAYNQLDKMSIASALRWSIETLRCAYPNAAIFVASPLQTNYGYTTSQFGNKLNFIKSEIVKKVCKFCSVYFIDSYGESGYSDIIARTKGGIHPGYEWKNYIAKYVANKIRTYLKKTKNDLSS